MAARAHARASPHMIERRSVMTALSDIGFTGTTPAAGNRLRLPFMLLTCSMVLSIAIGLRHSFGLFLQPMSMDNGWGREVFSFAIALQNLFWGLSQPFTGMLADRFGAKPVLFAGGLLYATG